MVFSLFMIRVNGYASSFEDLHYTTEEYPPYNYTVNGRKVTGLSVELLRLIWKELGVREQKITVLPWARAMRDLERQSNIVLFTTTKTPRRSEKFQWVCPIDFENNDAVIALKSTNIKINQISDLEQYVIGTIRNDVSEELLFEKLENHNNVIRNVTMKPNIELMAKGRIQLIAFSESAVYEMIEKWGGNKELYETVYAFTGGENCYAFSKNIAPSIVSRFQQAFDKINQTQESKEIRQRFFPSANN